MRTESSCSDLNGKYFRLGRPSSLPSARRTARYSVFKDRSKLRDKCLFGAPEARDKTGWRKRATPGNRATQCMRGPGTGQALGGREVATSDAVGAKATLKPPEGRESAARSASVPPG